MTETIIELTEIRPDSYKRFILFPIKDIIYNRKSHIQKTYLKASKILSFSEQKVTNKKHPMFRKDYPEFTLVNLLGGRSICVKESCTFIKNQLEKK